MALLLGSNRKQFQNFHKSQGSFPSSGQTVAPCKGSHQSLQTGSELIKERGQKYSFQHSSLCCPALPCPAQAWPSPPLSWTTDPGQPSHLLLLQTWASLLLSETPKLPADPWCQGTRGILNTNRNKPFSRCTPPPSPPATPRGSPSATHTPFSIKEGTAFAQRLTGGQLSG